LFHARVVLLSVSFDESVEMNWRGHFSIKWGVGNHSPNFTDGLSRLPPALAIESLKLPMASTPRSQTANVVNEHNMGQAYILFKEERPA